MSNERALLHCAFGWGKICHLYLDSLEVAGKSYNLDDLTAIYPTYRNVLGVPSARLELFFGPRRLVLRGIPDLEAARRLVARLQPYCSTTLPTTRAHSRSSQARQLVKEQARTWERSTKMPAIPVSPEEHALLDDIPGADEHISHSHDRSEDSTLAEARAEPVPTEAAPAAHEGPSGMEADPFALQEEQGFEMPSSEQIDSWPAEFEPPLHTPRLQPPLHSVHLVAPGQKLQDTRSMPVPAAKSSVLPVIHVPVRLQPGECAHYSIGASLCSDRTSGSERAPYPPLDHGLLILTNRRIFYLGKHSQLILAYAHLWYVSLLHNAIALHIEQQFRRIIIELDHPQEWASRIERLSFIARRTQPRPELPTLLMAALPGLPPSSLDASTLKRPAIKRPARPTESTRKTQKETNAPSLPGRHEPEIAEAQTISLHEESRRACADEKTQDILPAHAQEESVPQERELANLPTQDFSPAADPAEAATLDFPLVADLTKEATQDFSLAADLAEETTQELLRPLAVEERGTQELPPAPVHNAAGDERARTIHAREEGKVTTSKLDDPAGLAWEESGYEEIDTLPLHGTTESLEDEEAQTVELRKRPLARSEEEGRQTPVSDRLPDIEITPRCLTRARGTRSPAHVKKAERIHSEETHYE